MIAIEIINWKDLVDQFGRMRSPDPKAVWSAQQIHKALRAKLEAIPPQDLPDHAHTQCTNTGEAIAMFKKCEVSPDIAYYEFVGTAS